MNTDYRALCAELLNVFESYDDESNLAGIFDDMKANKNDLLDRARAALAELEPEVVGPTDEELMEAFDGEFAEFFDSSDGFGTTAIPRSEWIKVARAVLARWGRQPAPPAEGGGGVMADQHPITPTVDLIRKWNEEAATAPMADQRYIAIQAARWGADQELEACCEWVPSDLTINGESLRDVRRPEPPSLKEQALEILNARFDTLPPIDADTIRRALEALPDG